MNWKPTFFTLNTARWMCLHSFPSLIVISLLLVCFGSDGSVLQVWSAEIVRGERWGRMLACSSLNIHISLLRPTESPMSNQNQNQRSMRGWEMLGHLNSRLKPRLTEVFCRHHKAGFSISLEWFSLFNVWYRADLPYTTSLIQVVMPDSS